MRQLGTNMVPLTALSRSDSMKNRVLEEEYKNISITGVEERMRGGATCFKIVDL